MIQQTRHLIVSADKTTWRLDQPVLFLGKWCLREHDRNTWESMDAIIADPIGAEIQDRLSLHTEARRIESKLFPKLVSILNDYHGIDRDERYWRIVLGHWLRETVQLLLNRIVTIQRCIDGYQISNITLNISPNFVLAAKSYGDIWSHSMSDTWNTHLYAKILEFYQIPNILIENQDSTSQRSEVPTEPEIISKKITNTREGLYLNFRRLVDKRAREMAVLLGRDTDAFIINSYLPPEKELLLNLSLGQFPQRRTSIAFEVTAELDRDIRLKLAKKLKQYGNVKVEEIITSLLFEMIPVNYLEGYRDLVKASELIPWPKKPRFIFTSNSFVADEIFKVWTAEKVRTGTPYIAGQHGNGYGTHKYLEEAIEEVTSDKFLTWGWKRKLPQYTPAYNFKNASLPAIRDSEGAGILLIECNPTVRFVVWDQADDFSKYMSDQFAFVSSLEKQVKRNLRVRLHPAFKTMKGEEDIRWSNFDTDIKLDTGETPIRELWKDNRLIVHSYDSTGLLETLEANIPTLAFWQNGLFHLFDEALPYYELLISAGIVHLTPESAASKINEIWEDVDSWWRSPEVQSAREIFCGEYARTSQKPIRDLRKLLLETKGMLA